MQLSTDGKGSFYDGTEGCRLGCSVVAYAHTHTHTQKGSLAMDNEVSIH